LRLEGADLWTFLQLQIEIQERQLLLQASQQKLEIFGQIQKEKLGFTDEEILDPNGYVVSLQELQDRIRLRRRSVLVVRAQIRTAVIPASRFS
jgi:hypothetical protein